MSTQFAIDLVNQKIISAEQFLAVVEEQIEQQVRFGSLAIRQNLMTVTQVSKVLDAQNDERSPINSFGQQAIEMGFLKPSDIETLLIAQIRSRPNLRRLLVEMQILGEAEVNVLYRNFVRNGAQSNSRVSKPRRPKFRNRVVAPSTFAKSVAAK